MCAELKPLTVNPMYRQWSSKDKRKGKGKGKKGRGKKVKAAARGLRSRDPAVLRTFLSLPLGFMVTVESAEVSKGLANALRRKRKRASSFVVLVWIGLASLFFCSNFYFPLCCHPNVYFERKRRWMNE